MTTRVVLVEDDLRYRESFALLLTRGEGFTVAGSFATADAALAALEQAETQGVELPWDLVIMDLQLPGQYDGVRATRRIKERLPATSVVVLTVFEEPRKVLEAICAGADGYLAKSTPPAELLSLLRSIVAGGSPLTTGVARTVVQLLRTTASKTTPASPPPLLTAREWEVMRTLVEGRSYKQVAADLDISIDTVRSHIRAVYRKLQVHSVAEAVSRAIRSGLV